MYFIGLDVHLKHTTICVLDGNGRRFKQLKLRGPWTEIVGELKKLDGQIAVCYEASCDYGRIYELLEPICERVVVAHPGQLRLIFRSKRKNDRVDAETLATLLFLNEVPGVYVPSGEVRGWRQLIEYRTRVIDKRIRAKNSLRWLLRSLGLQLHENSARGPGRRRVKILRRGGHGLVSELACLPVAGLRRNDSESVQDKMFHRFGMIIARCFKRRLGSNTATCHPTVLGMRSGQPPASLPRQGR